MADSSPNTTDSSSNINVTITDSSPKPPKPKFWSLGDSTCTDFVIPLAVFLATAGWGAFQLYIQRQADYGKILDTYFTSLQTLENDVFKYALPSDESTDKNANATVDEKENRRRDEKENKRREAAKIIQSLAIAKTLIALDSLDTKRKGQIIEYLHNSNLVPKSYSDYDSSNNYICSKLTLDSSLIDTKIIPLSDEDLIEKGKAQQKVQIKMNKVQIKMNDVDLSNKNLPGISLAKRTFEKSKAHYG